MKKALYILFIPVVIGIFYYSGYGWRIVKASTTVYLQKARTIAGNLKGHVYVLSQQIGWRGLNEYKHLQDAAEYIRKSLQQSGYEVKTQDFEVENKTVSNIIAEKKGTGDSPGIILVAAHYDTYFNPGADNNASGTAALLELARLLANEPVEATVRFVAFVNAEGSFWGSEDMGSKRYLKEFKKEGRDIKVMIDLDSLGYFRKEPYSQKYPPFLGFFYPERGHFIAVVGNFRSSLLAAQVESVLKKTISVPVERFIIFDFIGSDHEIFWKENYPAILITDTGPYRNPYYLSLGDTYEKLDYLTMGQVTEGLSVVLKTLSQGAAN